MIIEIPYTQNKKPMNLGLYPKSKSYHGPDVFHPSPVYHKPTYHEPPVHHAKPHDLGRVKIQVRSSRLYSMLLIKRRLRKLWAISFSMVLGLSWSIWAKRRIRLLCSVGILCDTTKGSSWIPLNGNQTKMCSNI